MISSFSILSRYVCGRFLFWFGATLLVIGGFILLAELVEMIRRMADVPEATLLASLTLSLLKVPTTIQRVFHFVVLFSAMFCFWSMTRSRELVVARAAGVSAWQFLLPIVVAAALIGVLKIGVLNPVGALMYSRYERLMQSYESGEAPVFGVTSSGLWLRQRGPEGLSVIHAERAAPRGVVLIGASVLLFGPDNQFRGRIDAASATLRRGYWDLRSAWMSEGTAQPHYVEQYRLASDLTQEGVTESFASPESLSFWALPDLIRALDETGFSSLRPRLTYNAMLAQPVLLAAMVLFAAAFSLPSTRRGSLALIALGIGTGLAIFVVEDVVMALGFAETIPVLLAAWTPGGVALSISLALLLHFEEG